MLLCLFDDLRLSPYVKGNVLFADKPVIGSGAGLEVAFLLNKKLPKGALAP